MSEEKKLNGTVIVTSRCNAPSEAVMIVEVIFILMI